ncbi:hypothetical protein RFI_06217 [Reticulomyxa filosa]|uniref:Uncharacterized protein n=1 Tax=Reticulomyxa filosa TaxID=46433 RepID=X6P060_RETFI|nr:hypothetical protein RFI_06217 [Reticulomyxa filosa]|eukprot:ETO30902.1 hypothetical protein RFI_06217 [Reticulomyxa filosa]
MIGIEIDSWNLNGHSDVFEKKLRSGIELGQLRDLADAFKLKCPSVKNRRYGQTRARESSTTLNTTPPLNVPPAKPSATQKAPAVKTDDMVILNTGNIGKSVFVESKKKQASKSDKQLKLVELKPANEDDVESSKETKKDEAKPVQYINVIMGCILICHKWAKQLMLNVYKLIYIHIYIYVHIHIYYMDTLFDIDNTKIGKLKVIKVFEEKANFSKDQIAIGIYRRSGHFGVAQCTQWARDGKINVVGAADCDDDMIATKKKDSTYLVLPYLCVVRYSVPKTVDTCSLTESSCMIYLFVLEKKNKYLIIVGLCFDVGKQTDGNNDNDIDDENETTPPPQAPLSKIQFNIGDYVKLFLWKAGVV